MKRIGLLLLLVVLAAGSVWAATINVPADHATIQTAIDSAIDGDTVLVADGTYTGAGNVNLDFEGKAIAVKSKGGAKRCIVDCENVETRGVDFHNSEGNSSILDGFTIKNASFSHGAAIRCKGSSPVIRNCIIKDNFGEYGVGIRCAEGASPIIENTLFTGNKSSNYGAGVYAVQSSKPKLINCTITNNKADVTGGGVYCEDVHLTITNSILSDNKPNEVFSNDSQAHPDTTSLTILSSLIRGGRNGIKIEENIKVAVNWLVGNLDADPLFVDAANNNYRLSGFSPCIGVGVLTDDTPVIDIAGNSRPNPAGSKADIGAYEHALGIPARPINIPDPNLRAALEKALGKNEGDAVTKEDLAGLEVLK